MVPTIRDRMATLRQALVDVIIPAIPADEPLALEQAHLTLMQLGILDGQIDIEMEIEAGELQAARMLAAKIVAGSSDAGNVTSQAIEADQSLETVRSTRIEILGSIDRRIDEVFSQGDAVAMTSLQAEIVAFQRMRKPAEDRWFGAAFAGKA